MRQGATPRGGFDVSRIVLPACLFISGASALALEVVWAKYLTALVGSTALAHTVVLSTFMGGLAGGAWLFGRWADRTSRPLVLYAFLELGVALTCVVFPLTMALAGAVYVKTAAPLIDQTNTLVVLRAFLAVATIAIPSILMGGTLPAVTRYYVRTISEVGSGVARLYFINALGAVLGCLLAGFTLIPRLGLNGTLFSAASLNVVAALSALMLIFWLRRSGLSGWVMATQVTQNASAIPKDKGEEAELDAAEPPRQPSSDEETSPFPSWVARLALASIAVAGAASMTYEVVWIRILTLVMGGSTYAFTTMLAAFILGIAIGSSLVSWKRTRLSRAGLGGFGWLQIAVAAVTVLSVPLYNRLPYLYHRAARLLGPEVENYSYFLGAGFIVCLVVMIVPTILLGMTFPVAARLATRSIRSLGGGVGRTYASDTAGTVVGVVVAGHVLLPGAGLHGTILIAATANLVAGLVCVVSAWRTSSAAPTVWLARRRAVALGLVVGVLPAWMFGGPPIERESFTVGVFRALRTPFDSYHELAMWSRVDRRFLFDRDGAGGTVTVVDYPRARAMKVNGKTDASDGEDLETQYLAAHLPALLHPDPRDALVVGLGAGATSAGLLAHPDLRVVTAELSRDIVEAARYFEHVNRGALTDPRLQLVIDDVQAWLALSEEQFDIIVSVPSNPWVAGNASLFTVEFFERVKEHLKPGGLFLQWFHDYEMTDEAVRTILRTVGFAFPHVELFHAGSIRDYLLVCGMEPMEIDPERIDRILQENPLVREDLSHARVRSHLGIYARHILDAEGVRDLGGEGLPQRRSRPLLEYQAPKGLFLRENLQLLQQADLRRESASRSRVLLDRRLGRDEPLSELEWSEILDAVGPPFSRLETAMARAWAETGSVDGHRRLATALVSRQLFGEALGVYSVIEEAGELEPKDQLEIELARVRLLMDEGHPIVPGALEEALESMLEAARNLDDMDGFESVARLAKEAGRYRMALLAFQAASRLAPQDRLWPRFGYLLATAEAYRALGEMDGAMAAVDEALTLDPESARALSLKIRLEEAW